MKLVLLLCALLLLLEFCHGAISMTEIHRHKQGILHRSKRSTCTSEVPCCGQDNVFTGNDKTPFDPMTEAELTAIHKAMYDKSIITTQSGQTPNATLDNYIYSIIPLIPCKEDVSDYLYNNKPFPKKYAEVQVTRNKASDRDAMRYKVGPLNDLTKKLKITALTQKGEIPYNARVLDFVEVGEAYRLLITELAKLETLFKESFDGAYFLFGLDVFVSPPPGPGTDERLLPYPMGFAVDGIPNCCFDNFIHRIPVEFMLNSTSPEFDKWHLYNFFYLNQGPFDSAQALMDAYNNNTIRKVKLPKDYRKTLFDNTLPKQQNTNNRPFSDKPAPSATQPEGSRYRINGNTLSWMGYEMVLSHNMLRGPALFNIRFHRESIVYENSLSDTSLIYADDNLGEGNQVLSDGAFGLGLFEDLVVGVDCPEYATFLDTTWWDFLVQKARTVKGICVFEADGQEALWRRRGAYAGGMNNNYLSVRFVGTLTNYDYLIEYRFFLDGNMETLIKSTGYLQTSFYDEYDQFTFQDEPLDSFGYRVAQYSKGPIHDHTFGFKVDMDVIGPKNSFMKMGWKSGTIVEAMQTVDPSITKQPPYYPFFNHTRYIEREIVQNEGCHKINMEAPEFWVVLSNEKNKWGARRGYRIHHLATGSQTMVNAHPAMNFQSYTKCHLWLTKFKDDERFVTGFNDEFRILDPIVDFERDYANGENTENTDIVNWVTVSFLHVPTSENFPMTIREVTGFQLKPFNFFDRVAALEMPQYIDLNNTDAIVQERPPTPTVCGPAPNP